MKFIQARNYQPGRSKLIRLLVIHDMESPEGPSTAENVAAYFAAKGTRMASAHYCVDNNSVVQCVKDEDTAYAAKGANADGLHFELAGVARQTAAEWVDSYSLPMLTVAAELVAAKAKQYGIPVKKLTPAEVKAGKPGICGHGDVTKAFPPGTGHSDPGGNFPWPLFIDLVAKQGGSKPSPKPTPTPVEDDVELSDAAINKIADVVEARIKKHLAVLLHGTADNTHPANLDNIWKAVQPK